MEKARTYIIPVFALFLFSGATGLAYEVVWTRMLVRTFGATSFAVSTVLAAYMAGLALGSYIFGKIIDRRGNPVLIYGLLELGIGVFGLVFPFLLAGLNPLYRGLYIGLEGRFYSLSLIRFLLSFSMLLIPATLMGGTLPVLSRYVTRSLGNLTFRVGLLYATSTAKRVRGRSERCAMREKMALPRARPRRKVVSMVLKA
jgi:spermidine synthase